MTLSTRPVLALRRLALLLIRIYRAALSPLLGPSCRFVPSCSHYGEEAIERFGLLRGGALTAWRILRCHPFARGGLDLVPPAGAEPRATNLNHVPEEPVPLARTCARVR
jgi:uncharacterized protein